ncbi:hypothetical protein [Pyruvatibacter sp.]
MIAWYLVAVLYVCGFTITYAVCRSEAIITRLKPDWFDRLASFSMAVFWVPLVLAAMVFTLVTAVRSIFK